MDRFFVMVNTSESNERFDNWLKQIYSHESGIRDVDAVKHEAQTHHLQLDEVQDLPANNHILVFHKRV